MIFVFGSNEGGYHGSGAAKVALKEHGAVMGVGYGPQGTSFGIPTKDKNIETLPLIRINEYVAKFMVEAYLLSQVDFQITRIGCGLAGYKDWQIAPMFRLAPPNCYFDAAWRPYFIGGRYWGTFE